MIPVGYMAKRVSPRPEWIAAKQVVDIYSVSACISKDFANFYDADASTYCPHWDHVNGYWLFDTPEVIQQLAREHAVDLDGTSLFYYEVYEHEFDEDVGLWREFEPASFPTDVVVPLKKALAGYDVVSFAVGTNPECSPLSCSGLARNVETNSHCLLASFEQAKELLELGTFNDDEPGPYRIFAVYSTTWR
jgi:hypothetical protein